MQAVPGDGDVLHLRMDDRHHRIATEPGPPGGSCWRWEVADAAGRDAAADELQGAVWGQIRYQGRAGEPRVAGTIYCLDHAAIGSSCSAADNGETPSAWAAHTLANRQDETPAMTACVRGRCRPGSHTSARTPELATGRGWPDEAAEGAAGRHTIRS